MRLRYDGPGQSVNVAGVGKVPAGGEFDVSEERGAELTAKTIQRFAEVAAWKPEARRPKRRG